MHVLQLKAEAQLLSRLHHPNVLHFYGVCCKGAQRDMYMVTELCPSTLLSYLTDPGEDHSLETVVGIAVQVSRVRHVLPSLCLSPSRISHAHTHAHSLTYSAHAHSCAH